MLTVVFLVVDVQGPVRMWQKISNDYVVVEGYTFNPTSFIQSIQAF
jgi:hypothetical protein